MGEVESAEPVARLDDAFAPSVAFGLLAVLKDGADLEMATLRRIFPADVAALPAAVRSLEARGFVTVERHLFRTDRGDWVRATRKGRAAFVEHLAALRAIAWADEE